MNPDVLLAAAASHTTPLAIVDETVMRANITGMQTLADKVGAASVLMRKRTRVLVSLSFSFKLEHGD